MSFEIPLWFFNCAIALNLVRWYNLMQTYEQQKIKIDISYKLNAPNYFSAAILISMVLITITMFATNVD